MKLMKFVDSFFQNMTAAECTIYFDNNDIFAKRNAKLIKKLQETVLYKKSIIRTEQKYYIRNDKPIRKENVMEKLRKEVELMNKQHTDNKYFLNIKMEVKDDASLKHAYNVFYSKLVRFEAINIVDILHSTKLYALNLPEIKVHEILKKVQSYIEYYCTKVTWDRENKLYDHSSLLVNLQENITQWLRDFYKEKYIAEIKKIVIDVGIVDLPKLIDSNQIIIEDIDSLIDIYKKMKLGYNSKVWI